MKIFFKRKGAAANFSISDETLKKTRRKVKKIARSITPRDQKKIEHFFDKEKKRKRCRFTNVSQEKKELYRKRN